MVALLVMIVMVVTANIDGRGLVLVVCGEAAW